MSKLDAAKTTLTDFVSSITNGKEAHLSKEIDKVGLKYQKERSSLLGEVTESAVARWLPWRWKAADLLTSTWMKSWDPEAVAWQKEFESLTAWTMFVPDFLLKHVTGPIMKLPWFSSLVEHYPLWGKPKKRLLDASTGKLKEQVNPDDIIDFLRMVNQDIVMGKVTFDSVKK